MIFFVTMADIEKDSSAPPLNSEKTVAVSTATSVSSGSGEDFETTRKRLLAQQALVKSGPPVLPITTLFRRKGPQPDLDQIATQPSVYDDPDVTKYFQPMPQYENRHRFDPSARWTWREELPLINKLDWKVTLWAFWAFFALDLDRGNLSQVRHGLLRLKCCCDSDNAAGRPTRTTFSRISG